MKTNKRGELTTQQIVLLIVLIISFVVILYFIFRLNLNESSEKEICHNSVIMRGNSILTQTAVRLNCQRSYVCITKDGDCESMANPTIKKVSNEEEFYQVLADEMADCWWMFGEGKIDYVGDKALEKNYCSICTQLAFDDSLREIGAFESGQISQDRLYDYLVKTSIAEGKETYAEYLFGSNDLNNIQSLITNHGENEERISAFGTIDLTKQYFVMMGITSKIGNTYKWVGSGIIFLAFATPVGWTAGAILVGSGTGIVIGGGEAAGLIQPKIAGIMVEGEGVDNLFLAPTIIQANSAEFEALECKDVLTLA